MADRDNSVRFSWNAGDRFMNNLNPIIALFDATCERSIMASVVIVMSDVWVSTVLTDRPYHDLCQDPLDRSLCRHHLRIVPVLPSQSRKISAISRSNVDLSKRRPGPCYTGNGPGAVRIESLEVHFRHYRMAGPGQRRPYGSAVTST